MLATLGSYCTADTVRPQLLYGRNSCTADRNTIATELNWPTVYIYIEGVEQTENNEDNSVLSLYIYRQPLSHITPLT